MATVRKSFLVEASATDVWAALRDFGAVHERLVPGFLTGCRLEGDTRVVTFFNGAKVRERLVACDDSLRRLADSATGGRAVHHNASVEVVEEGPGRCRFVWTTDVLPDAIAPDVDAMMTRGGAAMKARLEAAT